MFLFFFAALWFIDLMRYLRIILPLVLIVLLSVPVHAQKIIEASGRILDIESMEPLVGVNISVKDKALGTVSDTRGYFYLRVRETLPLTLRFSMIGYKTEEYTVDESPESGIRIRLKPETYIGEEIIITTPVVEVEQKTMREQISIELLDAIAVRETPSANFYEALAHLKGVDVTTQSMQFMTVNARGFNSTENIRFVQVVDGMDNQIPGMSFSIGNVAGLNELDVESIEFLPGPSSVIYGANALNGLLVMTSKDPFVYQGLSAYVKPGISDLKTGSDYPFQFITKPLVDAGLRYATSFNDKIAFKINASIMRGKDWYANDTTNIRPGNIHYELDPGHDALNKYGDEITQVLPIGEYGENIIVARTGYRDKHLVDNGVKSIKVNAAVHYRITDNVTAILQANFGNATTVYTADNRIALSNFNVYQGKAELVGDHFLFRGYTTQQNTGDTYDSRYLAIHLNEAYASDEQWFKDYYDAYSNRLMFWQVQPYDHNAARAFADRNRLTPNSAAYNEEKERIINNPDFKEGARFTNNSSLYHLDGVYNFKHQIKWIEVQLGGSYRYYDLDSKGTIFPDTTGNDIFFTEYGGFVELSKKVFDEKVHITGSLRYDKSEKFQGHFSPRLSALYTYKEKHNFRASFLTGYRNPSAKEQFINKDLGYSRLVGGLEPLIEPFDLFENSIYNSSIEKFNDKVDEDMYSTTTTPLGSEQAILKNIGILQDGVIPNGAFKTLSPEQVISFEFGYKTKLVDKLFIDAVYYYSIYRDFIGLVEVVKPRTSPTVDLYTAAHQINNSSQSELFFIYTNAQEKVMIQGISLGMKYMFPVGAVLSGNATWSDLRSDPKDPIIPGFNTPGFKANVSISNRRLDKLENNPGFKRVGFNLAWRYQSSINWESPYASGWLEPYNSWDLQFSYTFVNPRSVIKAGVSNFLNIPYTNSFGGAQVGAFYYISYSIEDLFNF